ncbi:MAG: cell division protein SepF, partial [Clostridiaceae bacterium]
MSLVVGLKKAFGFGDEDYEDNYEVDTNETLEDEVKENIIMPGKFRLRKREMDLNESIDTEANDGFSVNIIKPQSFDEAMAMADELKKGKMLVINTGALDMKNAQRRSDFVSGSSNALSGEI